MENTFRIGCRTCSAVLEDVLVWGGGGGGGAKGGEGKVSVCLHSFRFVHAEIYE